MYEKPFSKQFYGDDPRWFVGVVETPSVADRLGRVRVRVYGLHTNDATNIDTYDLPLAQVMIPGTEEGTSGLGMNAQLEVGAMVFGIFLDGKSSQLPFVLGSFPRFEIADPGLVGSGYPSVVGAFGQRTGGDLSQPYDQPPGGPPPIYNDGGGSVTSAGELENDAAFQAEIDRIITKFPSLTRQEIYQIISGESGFNSRAISNNGLYGGLFQTGQTSVGLSARQIINLSPAQQARLWGQYLENINYRGGGLGMYQAAPGVVARYFANNPGATDVPDNVVLYVRSESHRASLQSQGYDARYAYAGFGNSVYNQNSAGGKYNTVRGTVWVDVNDAITAGSVNNYYRNR